MIEKHAITFEMTCDFCSEQIDTDEDEFMPAIESAKAKGWKVFKKNGDWTHKCPDCARPKVVSIFSGGHNS